MTGKAGIPGVKSRVTKKERENSLLEFIKKQEQKNEREKKRIKGR